MLTFCRSPLNWKKACLPMQGKSFCYHSPSQSGWWFQSISNIFVQLGSSSPIFGSENPTCLKPPSSYTSISSINPKNRGENPTYLSYHPSRCALDPTSNFPTNPAVFWTKPPKVLQRLGSQIVKPGGWLRQPGHEKKGQVGAFWLLFYWPFFGGGL